jgi:hypothetical protein
MDELELTELECDAVLLDDDAWNAKYAPSEPARDLAPDTEAPEPKAPEEPADPYEWMHSYLARLLPASVIESEQKKEKIWNGTISALKAADVRSKEQLDAMSSDDLKTANVPMTARHYILQDREGQAAPLLHDASVRGSSALIYGTKGSLYLSGGGGERGGGPELRTLARLQEDVERAAATKSQMSSV